MNGFMKTYCSKKTKGKTYSTMYSTHENLRKVFYQRETRHIYHFLDNMSVSVGVENIIVENRNTYDGKPEYYVFKDKGEFKRVYPRAFHEILLRGGFEAGKKAQLETTNKPNTNPEKEPDEEYMKMKKFCDSNCVNFGDNLYWFNPSYLSPFKIVRIKEDGFYANNKKLKNLKELINYVDNWWNF